VASSQRAEEVEDEEDEDDDNSTICDDDNDSIGKTEMKIISKEGKCYFKRKKYINK
jgi:hypothetical protein